MRVEATTDKERLRAFLGRDRLWGAYALGDLEPGLFEQCAWAVAVEGGRDSALTLVFKGLTPPGCLTFGAAAGIHATLAGGFAPRAPFFGSDLAHEAVVTEFYDMPKRTLMLRMAVDAGVFRSSSPLSRLEKGETGRGADDSDDDRGRQAEGSDVSRVTRSETLRSAQGDSRHQSGPAVGSPRRITPADLPALNALYAAEEGPDAFAPFQVEQGVFYGVEVDGRLAAAAGTHLVAPGEGIAAVGNVYTAPPFRGRGLAQACTSAVTAHLFALGVRDVVLNVAQGNDAAIRAYERLGFQTVCPFWEGIGVRREP